MTITLELDPELSGLLREKAKEIGADEAALALAYLRDGMNSALATIDIDPDPEAVEAIRKGVEDSEAGRVKPLSQVIDEAREKHGFPESWPEGGVDRADPTRLDRAVAALKNRTPEQIAQTRERVLADSPAPRPLPSGQSQVDAISGTQAPANTPDRLALSLGEPLG